MNRPLGQLRNRALPLWAPTYGEVYTWALQAGGPHGHSGCMNLDVLTVAMSAWGWLLDASAVMRALGVAAAGTGWVVKMGKRLRDPGEAPGGQEGEDREFFEDVLRPMQGGSPEWWTDQQRDMTWLQRRQRRLRSRERMK